MIDAHGCPVADPVWALYKGAQSSGPVSTLIEWDNNVPSGRFWSRKRARHRASLISPRKRGPREVVDVRSNAINLRRSSACRGTACAARALVSYPAGAQRFAVYRNNVVAGLVNALRARFPTIEKIVGEEFFAAMARIFVLQHPPRSPLIMQYGDDFGDSVAAFAPAAELPYLADVARLEAARTCAYHAMDAQPILLSSCRLFPAKRLAAAGVTLHPSLQVVRSRHPIVTIWAMNNGEAKLGPIDEDLAEDALVVRPRSDVQCGNWRRVARRFC